jgi:hypothetical protein
MIFGKLIHRRILLIAALLCLGIPPTHAAEPAPASAADLNAQELIRSLARPAPASIAFKEVRFSALLDQPLIVSGELRYAGTETLDRIVLQPYREETTIRGESVRVAREGERPRTFALKRAPELRGLLSAFSALLAGDPAAVERNFSVSAEGSRDSWRLNLTPSDAQARRRLSSLMMSGHGDEPICFWMRSGEGARSIMLFGPHAEQQIEPTITADELEARCAPALPAK